MSRSAAGPLAPTLEELAGQWRARAQELRSWGGDAPAKALERAAADLEAALGAKCDEVLNLEQAAQESGYSADHLRHLVADGTVPNAGRRGAPRVRRGDLPTRPGKARSSTYDPDADAVRILRGIS